MSEEYRPESNPEENPQDEAERPVISFRLIEGKPIVTYILLGLTVLVYAAQVISKAKYGIDWPLQYGAKFGPYISIRHEYWRLITPIFLHGSVMHLLFNMYALFTLGPALEHYYGHFNFLRFYLICGFAGNVLSYIVSPGTVSVGASTSLFGLIAAQAMFLFKNRALLRNPRRAIQNIGFVIIINLMLGLRGNIDNWGHLGGLFCGLLLSWLCGPELGFLYDMKNQRQVLIDTVPRSRREISCLLVTLFIAAAAYAL